MATGRRVWREALETFIFNAFQTQGLPTADSQKIARLMSQADLQGSDGHGVIRLGQYLKRIQSGGMNIRPEIRVVAERAGTALVDGDNGMGHLVVSRAVEIAADKARTAGVAWVGTRLSNHAGPPFKQEHSQTNNALSAERNATLFSSCLLVSRVK